MPLGSWSHVREPKLQNQASDTNLLHYLVLQGHDVRGLQEKLAALGLSSVGRMKSHV